MTAVAVMLAGTRTTYHYHQHLSSFTGQCSSYHPTNIFSALRELARLFMLC